MTAPAHTASLRTENWRIAEERRAGAVVARLQSCTWGNPSRSRLVSDAHRLILTLSPLPAHRTACLTSDDCPDQFHEVGDIVFMPANMPLHGWGSGGAQQVVELRIGDGPVAEMLRQFERWDQARLQKCLDIRSPALRRQMLELVDELQHPGRLGSALAIEGLASAAFIHTARFLTENADDPQTALPAWALQRIKARIANADERPPTVVALANLCGLSRRHLSRQFKAATGGSLQDYLASVRYARAKDLLARTDRPIKAIAHDLGFACHASFTSGFARVAGMSPARFRRSVRCPEDG